MLDFITALFLAGSFLNEQSRPASKPVSLRSHTGFTPMIRAFNAFQIVTLFAAMPAIVTWLHSNPFSYSIAAFWTSIVVYVVMFIFMCMGMFDLMEKDRV